MIARLSRLYGASPVHLAAHLALFLVAFWALSLTLDVRGAANFATWFVLAILLHDFVLLPAYSAVDRGFQGIAARVPARMPPAVNHLRFPAAISAVLLLAFFPPIVGRNDATFARVSGYSPSGYAARWAAICVALWVLSAVVYAVRARRSSGGGRRAR